MAHNAIAGFPAQGLAFRRKNKEWRKKCVDFGDDHSLLHYHLTDNDDSLRKILILDIVGGTKEKLTQKHTFLLMIQVKEKFLYLD